MPEPLDPISFRPTPADSAVIKGLREYLLQVEWENSREHGGGTVADALRFSLHLTGLVLQDMAEGSTSRKKVLVSIIRNAHQVANALGGEP